MTRKSWVLLATCMAVGLVHAGLALARGSTFEAFVSVTIFTAFAVYLVVGRHRESVTIMRGEGDERQRLIDREATVASYTALGVFVVIGVMIEWALGEGPGPYTRTATVGGFTYVLALWWLRRRR